MSDINQKVVLFYGRSGAGKGTQANLLVDYLRENDPDKVTLYVETGYHLREFAKRNNFTAGKVKEVLEEGGLLPEYLPIWLWTNFFIENYTGEEHLVLDGLARRSHEAPVLDSAFKFYDLKKPSVVLVDVSRDWAKEKLLSRGRSDDNLDDIEERLDWYEENVLPTVKFFQDNPDYNFLTINGEQTIEGVHSEIVKALLND